MTDTCSVILSAHRGIPLDSFQIEVLRYYGTKIQLEFNAEDNYLCYARGCYPLQEGANLFLNLFEPRESGKKIDLTQDTGAWDIVEPMKVPDQLLTVVAAITIMTTFDLR